MKGEHDPGILMMRPWDPGELEELEEEGQAAEVAGELLLWMEEHMWRSLEQADALRTRLKPFSLQNSQY